MHVKSDDPGGERNEMPGFPASLQTRLAVEELQVVSWASSVKWECQHLFPKHGAQEVCVAQGLSTGFTEEQPLLRHPPPSFHSALETENCTCV